MGQLDSKISSRLKHMDRHITSKQATSSLHGLFKDSSLDKKKFSQKTYSNQSKAVKEALLDAGVNKKIVGKIGKKSDALSKSEMSEILKTVGGGGKVRGDKFLRGVKEMGAKADDIKSSRSSGGGFLAGIFRRRNRSTAQAGNYSQMSEDRQQSGQFPPSNINQKTQTPQANVGRVSLNLPANRKSVQGPGVPPSNHRKNPYSASDNYNDKLAA